MRTFLNLTSTAYLILLGNSSGPIESVSGVNGPDLEAYPF